MTDAADPLRLQRLSEALIDAARRAGADQADALAVDGRSVSIDMRAARWNRPNAPKLGWRIGLRVLVGGRQAAVSSSDHRDAAIVEMAARAVAMAREAPVDDHLGLADPGQLARHRDAAGLELAEDAPEPEPQHLQDLAQRAEAAALDVAGISGRGGQCQLASGACGRVEQVSGGYARTGHSLVGRGDHRRGAADGARLCGRVPRLRRRPAHPRGDRRAWPRNARWPAQAGASRRRAPAPSC